MNNPFDEIVLKRMTKPMRIGVLELLRSLKKMEVDELADLPFINQIKKSVETLAEVLKDATCEDENKPNLIIEQAKSVEDAIVFISNAISSRLLSNRFVYETRFFNTQNIGPFSTLYGFYESLVDLFERLIKHYNDSIIDEGISSDLDILIDVSVHASVDARLFVPLTCAPKPNKRLIGLSLNEYLFFNIKDTIIMLLHEIGHYVRPFSRIKRNAVYRDFVIDWIGIEIYKEIIGLVETKDESKTPSVEENKLREYLETHVFTQIQTILQDLLIDYFDSIHKTSKDLALEESPYLGTLRQFRDDLELFFSRVDKELNDFLFFDPKHKKTSDLSELLGKRLGYGFVDPKTNQVQDFSNFDRLCSETKFAVINGLANNDDCIERYKATVRLLGISESTEINQVRFIIHAFQLIKNALETTKRVGFLEGAFRLLDESKADMFLLRALEIKNNATFSKIMERLADPTIYKQKERIMFFSPRRALVAQYFDKQEKEHGASESEAINIEEFEMFSDSHDKPIFPVGEGNKEKLYDSLRIQLFEDISDYLIQTNEIFPEDSLFLNSESNEGKDAKLITELRTKFHNLISTLTFDNEIDMLNLFP